MNGNREFTQRDLLKYIIAKIDDLSDKLDVTNLKVDNHINYVEGRITRIETTMSNVKWICGFLIIGIIGLVVENLVT